MDLATSLLTTGIENTVFTFADILWLLGLVLAVLGVYKFFNVRKNLKMAGIIKENEQKLQKTIEEVKTLTSIETQVGILVQSMVKIESMLMDYSKKTDLQGIEIALLDSKYSAEHERIDKIEKNCQYIQNSKNKKTSL